MSSGESLDWYDEKTAARILRTSPRTLRRWRKAGKIAHDRTPGGRVRYTFEQMLAFQRSCHVEAGPPVDVAAHGHVWPHNGSRPLPFGAGM
jgi:Helix-turn-helix domain